MMKFIISVAVAFLGASLNSAQGGEAKMKTKTEALTAVFNTSMGKITCELFAKQAPVTVANFVGLAEGTKQWVDFTTGAKVKRPFYDKLIFHRVIPDFMIQGGDPRGNGTGGPGFAPFQDEFDESLKFDRPGRLAMANAGPNTNGSQFFITEVPTTHLDKKHTIFGQCDDAGLEIVKKIARVETGPMNKPKMDVVLTKLEIKRGRPGKKKAVKTEPDKASAQ